MKKFFWILFIAFVVCLIAHKAFQPIDYPPSHDIPWKEYATQPDDITCGPTSTYMVLREYGKDVTLEEVAHVTKTKWFTYKGKPIGMTSPDYISVALNNFGVPAKMRHLTFDELRHHVSKNRPVIALVRSGVMTWHYVVVTGYSKDEVTLADPAWGAVRVMPVKDFKNSWSFNSDLRGVPTVTPCSWCKGTGKWFGVDLGPLSICEICDGSGFLPDFLGEALRNAEVYPMTAIVPYDGLQLSSVTKDER